MNDLFPTARDADPVDTPAARRTRQPRRPRLAVRLEPPPAYLSAATDDEEATIIARALDIIGRRLARGDCMASPADTRRFLRQHLEREEREIFGVLFLDNRHRVLSFERLFYGTIDSAAVHPREIVKRALATNAAAVILAHNHPSGVAEPSRADAALTARVRDALALVDVRTLDHFVIGAGEVVSLAERGLL